MSSRAEGQTSIVTDDSKAVACALIRSGANVFIASRAAAAGETARTSVIHSGQVTSENKAAIY